MANAMTFKVEDAEIIFKNFAGEQTPYNRPGDRNFACLLDPEVAIAMAEDGWNIKYLNPREEGDEPRPYIKISVGYKAKPPHVVMITSISGNRTPLNESMIDTLDYADIVNVDLIARAYEWDVNGKTGISAYLQTMYVTVLEDELQLKYAVEQPQEG